MKTKIQKPDVYHYNIADHTEFHETLYKILDTDRALIDDDSLLVRYQMAETEENYIYKWMRKSELTEQKATIDHQRDSIFSGIKSILHADLQHYDPTARQQAKHLLVLLDNYGDLPKAEYNAATAGYDSILAHFNHIDYKPAVTALQLTGWATELNRLNEEFKTLAEETEAEIVDKPNISPKESRKASDEYMQQVFARIESKATLSPTSALDKLIEKINVHVDQYNAILHEHYGRLHAKIDLHPSTIDEIPSQAYTGEPIYVIPKLTLAVKEKDGSTSTVKLVFTQDYQVSYVNNVNPGTATILIAGIGKYTGNTDVRFNIVKGLAQ
jgi:hypothetical protein